MVIGIFGQTAVGKTTVAKLIIKHYGGQHINLDFLAKSLYEKSNIKQELKKIFGTYIFNQEMVSVERLKEMLFQNPDKFQILNYLMFPYIKQKIIDKTKNNSSLIVIEGAILLQCGFKKKIINKIILIKSNQKEQIMRNLQNQKATQEETWTLLNLQKSLNPTKKKVDYIIVNNGSKKELEKKTHEIMRF